MQSTARKNELPLDKMCLTCEVTKKQAGEVQQNQREGAYTHGLFMEGARWDIHTGSIAESVLKDLYPSMPVMYIKAVTQVGSQASMLKLLKSKIKAMKYPKPILFSGQARSEEPV